MGVPLLDTNGQVEGEVAFPLDVCIPGFLSIDPATGKISAVLSGSLTLPVASLVTPTDQNRVRWIEDITNPASPELGYLDVVEKSQLGIRQWFAQLVGTDRSGNDVVALEAFVQGNAPLTPPFGGSIRIIINGATDILYSGSGGAFQAGPIVAVLPFNGNVLGNPATTLIRGNYYGVINMSEFPPNGVSPQYGDTVDVIVDGSWLWQFVYAGAWFFRGGAPRSFFSTSASTFSAGSGNVAMGFTYTIPRTGNYIIAGNISGTGSTTGASTQAGGIMVNGVATNTIFGSFSTSSASFAWGLGSPGVLMSLVAGNTVDLWANTNGNNAVVNNKIMTIIPVSIS